MSTFNGLVKEFPDIRIDYFRTQPGHRPPSACFLSHVHSDHLQGLDTLKMPFVYCSVATKRLLLRLEKYPHRINFAKGILEARRLHYRHLKFVLRSLPLNTPVEIELDLNRNIRVTLFDANHCPGAVMFLVEAEAKAVLYTGDIRAEPWWVNSLVQNPTLTPYTCGMKTLDCVYLDTTFASRNDVHQMFPTKASGLQELLRKVNRYGPETVFYFRSWTLGYENVWFSLASHLRSRIHVDEYQLRLFKSLAEDSGTTEWAAFSGFVVGNQEHQGILTLNSDAKIHSCEPGSPCHTSLLQNPNVVWITPIISRLKDGTEVKEIGAGGGGGDLYQLSTLDIPDAAVFDALEKKCLELEIAEEAVTTLRKLVERTLASPTRDFLLSDLELDETSDIPLRTFVEVLFEKRHLRLSGRRSLDNPTISSAVPLQEVIRFPFSRHSSYEELRCLISVLGPRDICPCTVDLDNWSDDLSMEALFGDLCASRLFKYDKTSRMMAEDRTKIREISLATLSMPKRKRRRHETSDFSQNTSDEEEYRSARSNHIECTGSNFASMKEAHHRSTSSQTKEGVSTIQPEAAKSQDLFPELQLSDGSQEFNVACSQVPSDAGLPVTARYQAYKAAKQCLKTGISHEWNDLGIRSISQADHTLEEIEL